MMTDTELSEASALFVQLVKDLTGKTLLPAPTHDDEELQRFVSEDQHEVEYYEGIDRLQTMQEEYYLLYINAINDEDAEKYSALHKEAGAKLQKYIYS